MQLLRSDNRPVLPRKGWRRRCRGLAKDRNTQLVYRSDLVKDQRTGGVVGDLTFEEALKQLLNGTGLTYEYLDNNAITIVQIKTSPGSVSSREGSPGMAHLPRRPSLRRIPALHTRAAGAAGLHKSTEARTRAPILQSSSSRLS